MHFDEDLAYETTGGRKVYGGGGIMPDYFVPLDTTDNSLYINRLVASNTIREYTLDYRDNHPELKELSAEEFINDFEVSDEMVNEIVKIGEEKGIRRSRRQLAKSEEFLKHLTKARIARDLFDDDAFFKVYNNTNEVYKMGIQLFLNPALLQNQENGTLLQSR